MDEYLLNCLLDQMQKGQKIGGNFTKAANLAVAHLISEKSLQLRQDQTSHENIENNCFAAKEILSGQYGSGFGFNRSTYMTQASASTWDSFIKAHPSPGTYRYKLVHHWKKNGYCSWERSSNRRTC